MSSGHNEIRIATIGNVDSAKSTTIGCICKDILDNGRGLARSTIMKHPHETISGRTSCITPHFVNKNNKVFGFIDLAGHEKYLKTTMSGLSKCFIDYAMVTIGVDRGIIGMTKEHMGIALALKIPMFIVLTKMDLAQEHKLEKILTRIENIMASEAVGSKKCKVINHGDDISSLENWVDDNICPIFLTSNTQGTNLDNLKQFIYSLPSRINWIKDSPNKIFVIDDVFNIKGIGIVLSGITKEGTFKIGDQILLGPFHGEFKNVIIKSIHNNFRESVEQLGPGTSGCINIRPLHSKRDNFDKKHIKKGMVAILNPQCIEKFDAEILVLKHPTTIRSTYQPVIHSGSIRQTARIARMDRDVLRCGDNANIRFEFLFHPEFLQIGSYVIFREGTTRGIGRVTDVTYKK